MNLIFFFQYVKCFKRRIIYEVIFIYPLFSLFLASEKINKFTFTKKKLQSQNNKDLNKNLMDILSSCSLPNAPHNGANVSPTDPRKSLSGQVGPRDDVGRSWRC
jgi:hypothetical protein